MSLQWNPEMLTSKLFLQIQQGSTDQILTVKSLVFCGIREINLTACLHMYCTPNQHTCLKCQQRRVAQIQAVPSQPEGTWQGNVGMLALSPPVLHPCCGYRQEDAGLPIQPFSTTLNSHCRRQAVKRKKHDFSENSMEPNGNICSIPRQRPVLSSVNEMYQQFCSMY